ncbi:hypothetical protein ACO03_21430 (plasmid) [Pantoea ananatis]|nr:hypothetical protein ACO03_21430 [Pantoea ananatis]
MRPKMKIIFSVVSLSLALVGCTSEGHVFPTPPATIIPPPAWTMEPPSNSVEMLDKIFSISAQPLSKTMKN